MTTLFEKAVEQSTLLSQQVETEEQNRRLSAEVLAALKEAGFHRLFVPKSLGGLEIDPITTAKLVEKVAGYNTAAGWSMMVANTAAWWNCMLPEKGIEEIYGNDHATDIVMAGAFHPPMLATRVNGNFCINGRSPLASNVQEAAWIFVTALVMEQNQVKMNNGIPEVIGVVMKAGDCNIIDTWHTWGMKATDSNDVDANNVMVPAHRFFLLNTDFTPGRYYTGPLYRFAAIGASVSSLIAPVALAVAGNAIQELKLMAQKKVSFGSTTPLRERGVVQRKLGMAEALVQSARAYLHQTLGDCWKKTLAGEKLNMEDRASLLLAATHTNQSCATAIDLVYSAAGSSAIYTKNKLSRYFTDAQVIRQHGFVNDSRYETAAQVLFGLQPDLPVLAF